MTVVALLFLENQRALPLERCSMDQILLGYWHGTPGIHDRTPRRIPCKVRKCSQRNRYQQNREHRDGPALPALFTFARNKRKKQKRADSEDRTDEQGGGFHRGRQEREHRIEPQEKEIRARGRLDDRGIGLPRRPKRSQENGTSRNAKQYESRKEKVFPNRRRNERNAVLFR